MAYAPVAHTFYHTLDTGTSPAIDTSGANLLVVEVSRYAGAGAPTLSDSKGNTWVGLTEYLNVGNVGSRLFYCASPTVGSGHTFTTTGATQAASVCTAAFSGAHTSPFDVENGASGTSGTLQPGSVTPSVNNCLIICGLVQAGATGTGSINSSFTITDQGGYIGGSWEGGALAYLIQTSASAVNPTWTWTGMTFNASGIAVFKPAAGGGTRINRLTCLGVG